MNHIAVTGCSYQGKMALYAGAFDERIALVMPEESGGGGWHGEREHVDRQEPLHDGHDSLGDLDDAGAAVNARPR